MTGGLWSKDLKNEKNWYLTELVFTIESLFFGESVPENTCFRDQHRDVSSSRGAILHSIILAASFFASQSSTRRILDEKVSCCCQKLFKIHEEQRPCVPYLEAILRRFPKGNGCCGKTAHNNPSIFLWREVYDPRIWNMKKKWYLTELVFTIESFFFGESVPEKYVLSRPALRCFVVQRRRSSRKYSCR